MKKIILCLILITNLNIIIRAQGMIEPQIDKTKVYVNFLSPGLYLEQKFGEKFTFLTGFDLGINASAVSNSNGTSETFYAISPRIRGEFRNYYNRKNQKLELRSNSGNFAGLTSGYIFSPIASSLEEGQMMQSDHAFYLGPIWGMQRVYKSGFRLELTLGYGYVSGKYVEQNGMFLGDFSIGYAFK